MNGFIDASLNRRLQGLFRLAEAAAEAQARDSDLWQHAVTVDVPHNHGGLTHDDLRWLAAERLVDHRVETTRPNARKRTFRCNGVLKLAGPAAFVLSAAGLRLVHRVCEPLAEFADLTPHWAAAAGELTFGGVLVKRLGASAVTQRALLDACQTSNWTNPIDNPFAAAPPRARSRYLCRALYHLNSGQQAARIRFSSIDKARRFRWALVDSS